MLIRHLYRQSKMKETDIILEESPWMLILHRSSRYLLMEVLSLLKLFLQNLDVKEDPNETIPMKIVEGIYFRKLQSYLTSNRPSVDQLYSLFLAIDQSLSTLSPDLADQSERVLLTTAKQIYTHLESHLPSLYKLSENGKADGMSQSIEMCRSDYQT
ncbi:hypothetical protein BC833DRAFT_204557 [Globomyces pollinis-pini]|nr:hypothetical protein BC833DRAFT_204557 [Globomyces pollinis-pini]